MKIKYLDDSIFVVELQPATRTLAHCSGRRYRISFPYLIFIAHLLREKTGRFYACGVQVVCRPYPLQSPFDEVSYFNFPNTGTTGGICMPFSGYGSTPEEVMERVIAEFFNSHFTYNLDHNGTGTPSQGRRILENWQILSQNPNYWKTHSFPNIGRLNYFISLNPELWRD